MKKILIIVLAIVVLAIGIYAFFARGSRTIPPSTAGTSGTLPSAEAPQSANTASFFNASSTGNASGQLSIVADVPVSAYFVNPDKSVLVVQPDGQIVSFSGNQTSTLSSITMMSLVSADFSYDGQKIVLSFGDPSDPQAAIFDVETRTWTSISGGAQSPRWSPSDNRLAYLRDNGNGTESLSLVDLSLPKPAPTVLGTFHIQDMQLAWAGQSQIFIHDKSTSYTTESGLMFDIKKQSLSLLFDGRSGLEVSWSDISSSTGTAPIAPLGLSFVSGQADRGGHLQLIDTAGDSLQNISFLTLPSKCTFDEVAMPSASSTTIASSSGISSSTPAGNTASSYFDLYCGVPRDQSDLGYYHLPDDYEQSALFTSDDLYRVNTMNGDIATLWSDQSQNIDVSDPKIFANSFFFINRYNRELYAVSL